MAAIIEEIRDLSEAQLMERRSKLRALARRLHSGESIDAGDVLKELDAMGATVDELHSALDNLDKRSEWRELLTKAESVNAEIAREQHKLDTLAAEFEAERVRCGKACDAIREKIRDLNVSIAGTINANRYLVDSCDNPELLAEKAALEGEARDLMQRLDNARRNRDGAVDGLGRAETALARYSGDDPRRPALEVEIARRRENLEALREAVADIEQLQRELAGRQAALREKMIRD